MEVLCIKCKGRRYCGKDQCAYYTKLYSYTKYKDTYKKEFEGYSPSVFVGHFGYPNINVGILAKSENTEEIESPREWASNNMDIPQIMDSRSSLVNSQYKASIKIRNRFLDISKEVGMASKPVEVEIDLDKKPSFRISFDPYSAPFGPRARLEKVDITSNPKIDGSVYKVVDDTDLKAADALSKLFKKGFDESFLTKMISIGNLGVQTQRKLVPTRWSITAVDDTLGKEIISEIKGYNESDYIAFFDGYLGNYYLIMLFPEVWSYELFEIYLPNASYNQSEEINFSTDYEGFAGRKDYAVNCAGGYYAARLPILEKLKSMKKQASVLVIRMITGEYTLPLGVWVCREASRKSIQKPIKFASEELMVNYACILLKKKFGYDISTVLKESLLLKNMKSQSKLSKYF